MFWSVSLYAGFSSFGGRWKVRGRWVGGGWATAFEGVGSWEVLGARARVMSPRVSCSPSLDHLLLRTTPFTSPTIPPTSPTSINPWTPIIRASINP